MPRSSESISLRKVEVRKFVYEETTGVCSFCHQPISLTDRWVIHHLDPSKKSLVFADCYRYSQKRLLQELESCVLAHITCHVNFHNKEFDKQQFIKRGPIKESDCINDDEWDELMAVSSGVLR